MGALLSQQLPMEMVTLRSSLRLLAGGQSRWRFPSLSPKVGGKLEDLVAVTFLQQKFKAWSTATAVGFVQLALHKSLTQLVLMTFRVPTGDIFMVFICLTDLISRREVTHAACSGGSGFLD